MLYIRKEEKSDFNDVYNLIKNAFISAEHSDGDEENLVNRLRESKNFVDDLSIVALDDKKIVGYVLFTKVKIAEDYALALAPIAVCSEYQNKGIGRALIEYGHNKARELGFSHSIVLGDGNLYREFGYKTSEDYNVFAPFDVPKENFMILKLIEDKKDLNGIVKYAKEFNI